MHWNSGTIQFCIKLKQNREPHRGSEIISLVGWMSSITVPWQPSGLISDFTFAIWLRFSHFAFRISANRTRSRPTFDLALPFIIPAHNNAHSDQFVHQRLRRVPRGIFVALPSPSRTLSHFIYSEHEHLGIESDNNNWYINGNFPEIQITSTLVSLSVQNWRNVVWWFFSQPASL